MQPNAAIASTSSPSDAARKRGKRRQVLVACNRCRRQKTACDSARPACSSCRRIDAVCQYDTERPGERRGQALQRRYQDLSAQQARVHDDLTWLRSQSRDTVLACVERLRYIEDPIAALSAAVAEERGRRRPPQIPESRVVFSASTFVSESTANELSAELALRFPATYPQILEPRFRPLQTDDSVATRLPPPDGSSLLGDPRAVRDHPTPQVEDSRATAIDPALLCDARLQRLRIAFWTAVPVSNELAACLISTYLRVEHPMYCFFHADLFLSDLCNQDRQHCTPLLVNALLFWTSCTYSSLFPQASSLTPLCLEAAQAELKAQEGLASALNVASLMILSISNICIGNGALARDLLVEGLAMAEGLGLVGERRRSISEFNPEEMLSMGYAAWGAFNFSCVYLLHFHDVHSPTYTPNPPLLPIPVGGRASNVGMRTAAAADLDGASFPYFCQFWCIAHTIASELYRHAGPIYQNVSLDFVEQQFRTLLHWAQSLPSEVQRSENMVHNVCEMHICYHATIMDLFRPFLAKKARLTTFSVEIGRPEMIFLLSMRHLGVLVDMYHNTFAGLPEACTVAWFHGPMYLAPATLRFDRDAGWEARFFRCVEACRDLLRAHAALETFLRAILGMAIEAGLFTVIEALDYLDELKAKHHNECYPTVPDVGFIVDHDMAIEDSSAATGSVLAERFDEQLFQLSPPHSAL